MVPLRLVAGEVRILSSETYLIGSTMRSAEYIIENPCISPSKKRIGSNAPGEPQRNARYAFRQLCRGRVRSILGRVSDGFPNQ